MLCQISKFQYSRIRIFVKSWKIIFANIRENPYYLTAGFKTRINDRFQLKPGVLLKYSNIYLLPETGGPVAPDEFAADFSLTLIMGENYYVSGFYGFSNFEDDQKINRYGLALHFLMDNIRLTYGLQRVSRSGTNLELPSSHLFSLGYRFESE